MPPTERTGARRVVLFVRDALPRPAQRRRERVVDDLADLEADGRVDDYEVVDWPKRFARDEDDHQHVRDRYREFSKWARERDVDLSPFFGTRECYSMSTGEKGEWVVLPALALAVYEDGRLSELYPHSDGDRTRSVEDGLDALETPQRRGDLVVASD